MKNTIRELLWLFFAAASFTGLLSFVIYSYAAESSPVPATLAVKAAIAGPEESKPGTSVVLSGASSVGKNHRWIYDKGYGFGVFTCDSKRELGFATTTEGVYKFWLVVSDASGVLDVAVHSVVITNGGGGGDDLSDKELAKALEAVASNARAGANLVNDPPTLKNIVAQWKAASGGIRGSPSLEAAGKVSSQAFEAAMAQRTGLSRYKDWEKIFRRPLNTDLGKLIDAGLVKTPADFDKCIQVIAEALIK